MAKQNFLSGGFYGKLGQMVGQRWKNKRTIRVYVVPQNPRTERQQRNRGKFADAVEFSQMGMQMNYYATCFEHESITKWNYRMSTSRHLKDDGLSGLDLIPLYPTSFTPPTLLQSILIDRKISPNKVIFAVDGLTDVTDRTLSMMFDLRDSGGAFLGYKLYVGYYNAETPGYIECEVDDVNEITNDCFVRIVSNDDEDSTTDMIASPRLQIGASPIDVHTFNYAIRSVVKTQSGVTITFEELWKEGAIVNDISGTINGVSAGESLAFAFSNLSLQNNNGFCSVFIPREVTTGQEVFAFPVGSSFAFTYITFITSTMQATASNVSVSYSDSDLERELSGWTFDAQGDVGTFYVSMASVPSSASPSTTSQTLTINDFFGVTQNFNVDLVIEPNTSQSRVDLYVSGLENQGYYTGDAVTVPSFSFTANGVTYKITARTMNLSNTGDSSYLLSLLTPETMYAMDGNKIVACGFYYDNFVGSQTISSKSLDYADVTASGSSADATADEGSVALDSSYGSRRLYFQFDMGETVIGTLQSIVASDTTFTEGGIEYIVPEVEWNV